MPPPFALPFAPLSPAPPPPDEPELEAEEKTSSSSAGAVVGAIVAVVAVLMVVLFVVGAKYRKGPCVGLADKLGYKKADPAGSALIMGGGEKKPLPTTTQVC